MIESSSLVHPERAELLTDVRNAWINGSDPRDSLAASRLRPVKRRAHPSARACLGHT